MLGVRRLMLAVGLTASGVLAIRALRRRARRRPPMVRAGGHLRIARCPLHGVAYDVELEQCPECAKSRSAADEGDGAAPSPGPGSDAGGR